MRNLRYWENIKIEQNKYWANHIDCRLPENFCLQTIAYSVVFFINQFQSKILDKRNTASGFNR